MDFEALLKRVDPLVLLAVGGAGVLIGLREPVLWKAMVGFIVGGAFLVALAYKVTHPDKPKTPRGQPVKGPPSPPVIAHHPLPYVYCAHCQRLFAGTPSGDRCPRCAKLDGVTVVRSAAERAALIAQCDRSCSLDDAQ